MFPKGKLWVRLSECVSLCVLQRMTGKAGENSEGTIHAPSYDGAQVDQLRVHTWPIIVERLFPQNDGSPATRNDMY